MIGWGCFVGWLVVDRLVGRLEVGRLEVGRLVGWQVGWLVGW